jgi:hypothetical protein
MTDKRDESFSEGGAVRESAKVQKEDLLTKEYCVKHNSDIVQYIYACHLEREHTGWEIQTLIPDGGFNPQWIKAVSDWACTKREPPYPPNNWVLGMPVAEVLRSALRHWRAFNELDELNDPESGLPHEWHFQWNLYVAIVYITTGTGT